MNSFGLRFVAKLKLYAVGYAAFIDARTHTLHTDIRDRAVNRQHRNLNSFDRLTRNVIFLCNECVKLLFLK